MRQCGLCRRLLEVETPKEEAEMVEECDELFGPTPPEERAVVCHECFVYMTTKVPPPYPRGR